LTFFPCIISHILSLFSHYSHFSFKNRIQCKEGIALFDELIIKNYKRFLKLLNQLTYEFLTSYYSLSSISKPDFFLERTLYSFPNFSNFPLIEAPLNDFEFKSFISQSKSGHLIHLQSIQVLKIYPPECFLWLQLFIKPCDCLLPPSEKKGPPFYLKHSFLDVLKANYNDLRAVIKKKLMVCGICGVNYHESEQNRVFLNCQKIEAFMPELSKKTHLWLLDGFLNKLKPGMRFNGVCFYDINLEFNVQNSRYLGGFREYFVLISANLFMNVMNRTFFQGISKKITNNLHGFPKESGLFGQWLAIKALCNIAIGFNLLPNDTLISLRISLFASLTLKNRVFLNFYSESSKSFIKPANNSDFLPISDENNLHLFIIGENESLITRTILEIGSNLENFGIWPYNSDDNSLYDFLMHMQDGIIFIPDAGARLKKNELYLLTKILRREEIDINNKEKLFMNSTLWFYGIPNIKPQKEAIIWTIRDILPLESYDNLDIVIDISRRNAGLKRIKHEKFDLKASDKLLNAFLREKKQVLEKKSVILYNNSGICEENLKENLKKIPEFQPDYHENDEIADNPSHKYLKDQPLKLMQAYFRTARKAKAYSIGNYNSFRKTCIAISLIRGFSYGKNNGKIELIDVILAIMLDEMSTSNKFKENERVNSVVFGTVKGSKIGGFWMDCEEEAGEGLEYKEKEIRTGRERERGVFYEIYEEIMELCARAGNGNEGIM